MIKTYAIGQGDRTSAFDLHHLRYLIPHSLSSFLTEEGIGDAQKIRMTGTQS